MGDDYTSSLKQITIGDISIDHGDPEEDRKSVKLLNDLGIISKSQMKKAKAAAATIGSYRPVFYNGS